MRLPVPTQVADEALAYAHKVVDEVQHIIPFGMDVTVWHPEYGSRLMQNVYKMQIVYGGAHGLQNVIDKARADDDDAHKALLDCYSAARHGNINVPPALAAYVDEFVLRGGRKRRRGRRASKNAVADLVIASCVKAVVNKFNLPPTRRDGANHHERSACDLIVLAMRGKRWTDRTLNYKRIEGIFIKHFRSVGDFSYISQVLLAISMSTKK
jgi:hypothetical protein